jgi:hypothetical protein
MRILMAKFGEKKGGCVGLGWMGTSSVGEKSKSSLSQL